VKASDCGEDNRVEQLKQLPKKGKVFLAYLESEENGRRSTAVLATREFVPKADVLDIH